MLAAVLRAPGPPTAFSLEEAPAPSPAADEVLVRVRACGVSHHDVVERNGVYKRDVVFPLIQGMEIGGVVEAVGPAVTSLAVGDRICTKAFASCGDCRYCRTGRETTCRRRRPVRGGYGQFTVIPEDAAVRTPPDMAFEVSCTLGAGAGVALNAVRDTARVQIGETVLVTGASGGVGLATVQLARLAGARVIGLTRNASKATLIEAAGAEVVIVAGAGEDFSRQVRDLTAGEGAEVVIDTVGSAVFAPAFAALAPHGRYALVGQLSGEEITINPARIFFKRAQLLGVGSVSRAQLADAIRLVSEGRLTPRIGRLLPLSEIAEAHRLVEAAETHGRVVVQP